MLAAILLSPDSLHLRAISDRTELPYAVVQREIDRLERGRLVVSTRFGTARVVRPNESHPLYSELRALLLKAYGPREVLGALFEDDTAIVEAYLYGSWAARYLGEWGEPPADLDLLLVGNVPPARREELEAEAEDILGQPVQIEVVGLADWRKGTTPFLRTLKRRPLVPLRREAVP